MRKHRGVLVKKAFAPDSTVYSRSSHHHEDNNSVKNLQSSRTFTTSSYPSLESRISFTGFFRKHLRASHKKKAKENAKKRSSSSALRAISIEDLKKQSNRALRKQRCQERYRTDISYHSFATSDSRNEKKKLKLVNVYQDATIERTISRGAIKTHAGSHLMP